MSGLHDRMAAGRKVHGFDDPDWRMDLTALRSYTVGAMGVAVYRVEYHDVDGSGPPMC